LASTTSRVVGCAAWSSCTSIGLRSVPKLTMATDGASSTITWCISSGAMSAATTERLGSPPINARSP
jgi:hypothetical protein